jgi:hypothetical protein
MRNLKKFLALLLSVMMIATTAVIVSAEDATDYTEAAEVLVSTGALKGYTDGKLHLEDDVQRYQMALFIARMMTGDVDDTLWSNFNTTSFTDIDSLSQYVGAISFVTDEGVIKGRSETIFDPYAQITYQEAVTMLVRALGYTDLSYPFGFIQAANKIGLTGGIEGVEWSEPLTRGEVTQLLYNTIKFVSDFGTGDGSYTYEGDCFDKFDSFVIVDDYIADYNATTGYATFSLGEKAALEDLGIEEPSDAILGSWYELFMLEDEVIKIDACEVVDAEADSYMDPAGEEIDEEDLDDDFVAITVYATRENGNVGVVKVSSYVTGDDPCIGYTYAAGEKSTEVDLALEWATYRVVSLKDGKAALKLDGDKEATLYTYDYGAALNGIKTAEEIEEILNEALSFGGVVSVVLYEDAIIDAVAGEVEDPIILILDIDTLLEVIDDEGEFTGFLSADVYSDAFEGKKTIEISAISGGGYSYDYNEVFDPDATSDSALQKALQKTIIAINKSDKFIFTGTRDKFDKWTLEEAPLYFGKLVFQNEIGKAQIELYDPGDYDKIGGSKGNWTLDTSATKTASVFYDFDPAKDSDEKKDALTGKTYTLGKDVTYYIISDGKISTFVGQPSTDDVLAGDFVYPTIVNDSGTVIVVADAAETTVEAPKQYVTSDGVYGRWSRKYEDNKYVYYYNLYGLVDYRTDENIVITWKADREDLNHLEEMVDLLNYKIVEGALYTIDYNYDEKGNVNLINLVEMTLADYWEDDDIYQLSTANYEYEGTIIAGSIAELGTVSSKVKKVIQMDEMSVGLLYDVGFDFDEKTGYLYVYPTEVGAKVSYDKKDGDKYYEMYVVEFVSTNEDDDVIFTLEPQEKLVAADDIYVRYGTKLVFKELAAQKTIQKGPETNYTGPFYTIGANPDKEITGKFKVSKGADEDVAIEFALTGGEVTVEYKEAVEETKAEPSYAKGTFPTVPGYQNYSNELRAWMADMYNRNGIVDKTVYKYVAWTSDITDVDVFYQRIVPKLTGNSNGNINYINYRIETVEVENWDIVSPFDLIITGYNNLEDATGSKHIFNADDGEVSYIIYITTTGSPLNIYGVVYAYGKIVDEKGKTIDNPSEAAVYTKFVQCTESEYAAQFNSDGTRKTGDGDKGYKAYAISFKLGLISFNVTSSAGKNATFNINLIKAYDETTDGKYILIDYNNNIVVGARVATTIVKLDGTEYKPATPEVKFSEGKAAEYEYVVEKQ